MEWLKLLFILLHVITAAAWFGLALRLGGQARQVERLEGDAARALAQDGAGSVRLMGIFVLLTFAFSMGLLLIGGGYAGMPQYHIASLLIVVLCAVQYLLIRPGWMGLLSEAASTSPTAKHRKRVVMGVGIGHLLWVTLVVLMFWNRIVAIS